MILVITLHLLMILEQRYNIFLPYIQWQKWGAMSVGTFLFISGFGLTRSLINRGGVTKEYIYKSIRKLLLPYSAAFLTGVVACSLIGPFQIDICDFLTLTIPMTASWFVKFIFVAYVLTLLLFRFVGPKTTVIVLFLFTICYIVICKWLGMGSHWYNSSLCFSTGAIISLVLRNKTVVLPPPIACTSLIFSVLMLVYGTFSAILNALLFSAFSISAVSLLHLGSVVISYLGKNSYQFYVFHIALYIPFASVSQNGWVYCLSVIFATVICVLAYNKVSSYISRIPLKVFSSN